MSHRSTGRRPRNARFAALRFAVVAPTAFFVMVGCSTHEYAARYGGSTSLTLVNDTRRSVCFVNMGPATNGNWGDDWLGSSETVRTGHARAFMVAGGNDWDIRTLDCSEGVIAEGHHIVINGPTTLNVSALSGTGGPAPSSGGAAPTQGSGSGYDPAGGSLYGSSPSTSNQGASTPPSH
jgi:hypothetical protein